MITQVTQRWFGRRGSYRQAGEPINPRLYEVAVIPDDTTAKRFVEAHHYCGTYPSARFRVGLYRVRELLDEQREAIVDIDPLLVGAAVFSQPMSDAIFKPLKVGKGEAVELGRLVLLKGVEGNGCTWFGTRALKLARAAGFRGVISDADPYRTQDADGNVVCRGHVGGIYKGLNATYLGQAPRRTRYLLPNGRVFCQRSISKIRSRERNWEGPAEVLESFGATHLGPRDDARAWLATWMPRLTRRIRHPGNHRYAFGLDKHVLATVRPLAKPYVRLEIPMAGAGS